MADTKAQIVLEVAEAIGTHLRVSELLAALNEKLKPIIYFDAIGIGVLEDEVLRIQCGAYGNLLGNRPQHHVVNCWRDHCLFAARAETGTKFMNIRKATVLLDNSFSRCRRRVHVFYLTAMK